MPHRIVLNQDHAFDDRFANSIYIGGDEIQLIVVQMHSTLIISKQYHQPVRTTVPRLMVDHPGPDNYLTMVLCVKAIILTVKRDGVVPPAPEFGKHSQVHPLSKMLKHPPTHDKHMNIVFEARQAMEMHIRNMQINRVLKHAFHNSK